jgi:hypothetical protein
VSPQRHAELHSAAPRLKTSARKDHCRGESATVTITELEFSTMCSGDSVYDGQSETSAELFAARHIFARERLHEDVWICNANSNAAIHDCEDNLVTGHASA